MNSWQTLLLLDVAYGRCIAKRLVTQQEHVALWMLATQTPDTLRATGWNTDDWDKCAALLAEG